MPEEIQQKLIEDEMQEAYIDYSMSVIVGRALPDVRDGLKPVHRRILYAMNDLGLLSNKPFKKSARIVGNTLGLYHPHGDTAVYDALVRLAQDFSLRYPLVDGQGNFGSIDGFSAASMRYTEARLSKIAEELLVDIDKDTVNFTPNFDNSLKEPVVLPSRIPNLLVNGSSGIAVGMATNIPPHNIREISNALISIIDNKETTTDELMNYIKGPDFPTGGFILGRAGIKQAYKSGKGKLIVRAKSKIEKNKIIITEIPYMVNKTSLIEDIVSLVKDKRIEGISDIRDESDRRGMSIVIETKNINPEIVLNNLCKYTQLQTTFGVIMLALHDNQPRVMPIKQMLAYYLDHRKDVVTRRTKFDLDKAEKRAHILEGLKAALKDIDNVIALIKKSKDVLTAKASLMNNYQLTEIQSNAILEMRLQRLTSLERNKIDEEYSSLLKLIKELKDILASEQKILWIIKNELTEIRDKYQDERRTQILDVEYEIETEDLVKEEDIVITSTHSGYIKQIPLETYKQQRRGGKGIIATIPKEEDIVEHLFVTNTHSYLLFFTNKGKVHWLKAFQIPQASRYSKGKAIVNLLNLEEDEMVNTILPIYSFEDHHYLLFATKKGIIKKTSLLEFSNPRRGGIKAVSLKEDELVQVRLTPGNLDFILATKNGLALRFNETDVRSVGRNASGVRGIRLRKNDCVIGMEVALTSATLLTVTENGYGKRTDVNEYRTIRRGGKGVISIQTKYIYPDSKNGAVIGIKTIKDNDEVMLISQKGVIIRIAAKDIGIKGRNTQGVRLMKLVDDKVKTLARVIVKDNNH